MDNKKADFKTEICCKGTTKIVLSKGQTRHVTSRDAKKYHFFAKSAFFVMIIHYLFCS